MEKAFTMRFATEKDVSLILDLIHGIAKYEKMENEVVATEDLLREWLFEKHTAETLLGEFEGKTVGFALFFHNFSTFMGRAGIYLEDFYVIPEMRGRGFGKALFQKVASIAVERGCGRMEWCCLDWNQPSIKFYLAMGAKPMSDWTTYRLAGEALQSVGTMNSAAKL